MRFLRRHERTAHLFRTGLPSGPIALGFVPRARGLVPVLRLLMVTEALHTGCHDHLAEVYEGTIRACRQAGPDSPQR